MDRDREKHTDITDVLNEVGPRLRRLRTQRGVTLTALAETTGISKSTLSRLESGGRRPSLELLLPIAQAHRVPWTNSSARPRSATPACACPPVRSTD
jgi:transcriptional regulator with XRE-family HTH domain